MKALLRAFSVIVKIIFAKVHSKLFSSDRAEPDPQWRFMLWLGVEERDLAIYWVTSNTTPPQLVGK